MTSLAPASARLVYFVFGLAIALGSWWLLVPWDLSEVDASGRATETGGDDAAIFIAAVLVIIFLAGIFPAIRGARVPATSVTVGGTTTWALVFAWRASTARVTGAKLWVVAFVAIVVPAAVAVSVVVFVVGRHRARRAGTGASN